MYLVPKCLGWAARSHFSSYVQFLLLCLVSTRVKFLLSFFIYFSSSPVMPLFTSFINSLGWPLRSLFHPNVVMFILFHISFPFVVVSLLVVQLFYCLLHSFCVTFVNYFCLSFIFSLLYHLFSKSRHISLSYFY